MHWKNVFGRQISLKTLFAIVLLFCFACFGQTNESEDVKIPDDVMRQVVSRILTYKFKPANRPKTIYLVKEGLQPTWLPDIPNIEFRLLSGEELEDREADVYFFTKPGFSRNTYDIGFAFGDPNCGYTGESWQFRVSKGKVRLWPGGEIGGGCTGFGNREFKTPGQLNTYPNELKGFRFFDKGRLRGLKLTVSTKDDVKRNFGADCASTCDYDENWQVNFTFFGNISKESTVDNKKIRYVPKEEYVKTLYSITLTPKRRISFSQIIFGSKFNRSDGFAIGDGFDTDGRLTSAVGIQYKTYQDRYGLIYTIFQKVGYTVGEVEKDDRREGDLTSIEYTIPDQLEAAMFAEQK